MEVRSISHADGTGPRDYDHAIELDGVPFEAYRMLVESRDESRRRSPRMSYLDGKLRLVSPSSRHERAKRYLEDLLRDWTVEVGIELVPYGGTTQTQPGRAGAEPDTSYQLGAVADDDRRPDFVVEVEHRNPLTRDSFATYGALGIREVWWLEVAALDRLRAGEAEIRPLRAYVLGPDGFVENASRTSESLPGLNLTLLARAIAEALEAGPRAGRTRLLGERGP